MIKAYIFDMDGTVSDTQRIHAFVESEILKRFGIFMTSEEITEKYAGVKTEEFFEDLLSKQNKPYHIPSLIAEKWEHMELLAQVSAPPMPGAIRLIKELHALHYPLAIASASYGKYVEIVLRHLRIQEYFSSVITGDMVSHGKPHPESFLLAAHELGVDPKECLVFEDGLSGIQAAKTAGMKCIAIRQDKNRPYETPYVVSSLEEVDYEFLQKIQ